MLGNAAEEKKRLQLLKGNPIPLSNGELYVYPFTIGEMVDNYEDYMRLLHVFFVSLPEGYEDFTLYTFMIEAGKADSQTRETVKTAFAFFLREEVDFSTENNSFYVDKEEKIYITQEIFDEIVSLIKSQNFFHESEEEDGIPANEEVRRLQEKKRENKIKVARARQRQEGAEDGLDLADLISIVATNTSLNIIEVWSLPIYAFYNQLRRMQAYEGYDTNLRMILAGADSKKIKLDNWMKKM